MVRLRGLMARYAQAWWLLGLAMLLMWIASQVGPMHIVQGMRNSRYYNFDKWYSAWDGQWYGILAQEGYDFIDPYFSDFPALVFFPLYPVLGWLAGALTGLDVESSLFLVTHLSLFGLATAWLHYAGSHPVPLPPGAGIFALALLLFFPSGYFLHMNYTEALFTLLATLWLWGMHARWRWPLLLLACGLMTATRPTGVVCCPVMALHAWRRLEGKPPATRLLLTALLAAASGWGLLAYMAYQQLHFGDALLFLTQQASFNDRPPGALFLERLPEMLTLRPAWIELVDYQQYYLPFTIQNCVLFPLGMALLLVALRRRWLTPEEALYCTASILLFYVYKAPHFLEATGRYLLSLPPLFLALARLLAPLPPPVSYGLLTLMGALMLLHGCLSTQWYYLY